MSNESFPNANNSCGGKYQDWLEVLLLPECNANCSWCVEKNGFHPRTRVTPTELVGKALQADKTNILLLGGEPTLHPHLQEIINRLKTHGKNVFITTNGSLLSTEFVQSFLRGINGVNISIHHFLSSKNMEITGLELDLDVLSQAVAELHGNGAKVRLNCNCIKGYIDDWQDILRLQRPSTWPTCDHSEVNCAYWP